LEGSDDLANWYGHQAVARPKLITPEEFLKIIAKITPADIKRVAKNIFRDDRLNLAVIGAVKTEAGLKKILHF
jgi:predicted Zn-dependent peptidase